MSYISIDADFPIDAYHAYVAERRKMKKSSQN